MHRRRGYTLVEMLVVITLGTTIVGISVGALQVLFGTEQTGRARIPRARVLGQLAEQFRCDVHAALPQNRDQRQDQWQFALPDDRLVTYRALPGEIKREEHVAGKLVRQESYALPGCSTKIGVRRDAKPTLVTLAIANSTKGDSPIFADTKIGTVPNLGGTKGDSPIFADTKIGTVPNLELQVIAQLGKDHRFGKSATRSP